MIESGLSDIEFLSNEDGDDGWHEELSEGEDIFDVGNDEEVVEDFPQDENTPRIHGELDIDPSSSTSAGNKKIKKKGMSEKELGIENFMKNNELTMKADISWRTGLTYFAPEIKWHADFIPEIVDLKSPLYFFSQYFTQELFEIMAENTNLYAVQQATRFLHTTVEEMKTFVGIHILMGNLHYPRIKCYWNSKLQIPNIANSMPVNYSTNYVKMFT
ncbi:hypothetical protein JTB14_011608 [Gonioctena quinquepunctata]|nr:hypothetical protein JTB14_011608 [Gonioctena quinquepunctata]